jgi:hypothetical protein
VANAQVTLTSTDNGLVLQARTDNSGVYTFSPVKIGNYKVSATAPGFATTTQQNVHLDVQQRLPIDIQLKAGSVSESVEVTTSAPLMQSEEASVGQVLSTTTVNDTPLNGRNWVYIAQLTAGVTPSAGSRGEGKGDFEANGQRAEQNNFILDGVDNNTNVVDFLNGASYIVRPPPDALAEFKVQTGDYSAEFGHSAGAVVNASIKSGTNQIHGDVWEYWRNNDLDARDWDALSVPDYHENQFGATLGFPIIKNKLFFFGDLEANRIVFAQTSTNTVPTALMRTGDFSELLSPSLTGTPTGIQLYQPNTSTPIPNNQLNLDPSVTLNQTALRILNLYPVANTGAGALQNNYIASATAVDNTFQFDTRMDWNASSKDQAFFRFSLLNEPSNRPGPLGPVLDGGSFSNDGGIVNLGQNTAFSETHVFTNTLTNEFRFGYNWGHFAFNQSGINQDTSAQLGLGGIPYGPLNGGLPYVTFNGNEGISHFGAPEYYVSSEYENVFQILDNVSKIVANHSLKFGISFQHIRFATLQPPYPRGVYTYNGQFTGQPGVANTGSGVADFLLDQQYEAQLSNLSGTDDERWDRSVYAQDDWKATPKLTLNLGLRYEYPQSYNELFGRQANFYPTGPLSPGSGTADYVIPSQSQNVNLGPNFANLLAANHMSLSYSSNSALVNQDRANFAPRFGLAYRLTDRATVRGGYGLFYGGLESTGYGPNIGENFPFQFQIAINAPTCTAGNCASDAITLANGFTQAINVGLINYVTGGLGLNGIAPDVKTPYAENYNLAVEYGLTNNMVATVSYVGSQSHHLIVFENPNGPDALLANGANVNPVRPFPDFSNSTFSSWAGKSAYNSLQTKLERRFANGLTFLATYTWSHALDDAPTPLGSTGDDGYRSTNLVPISADYSNSPFDVRNRFTFNGSYELPFGAGKRFANHGGPVDYFIGGWSSTVTFAAETGTPFSVTPESGFTGAAGANTIYANLVGAPFAAGATGCPNSVRNRNNWYNPCAFDNPVSGAGIPTGGITGTAVLPYLGGKRDLIPGPGDDRVNLSLFKNFRIVEGKTLQFRADIFNLFNTPSFANPTGSGNVISSSGNATDNPTFGGQLGEPKTFQELTPDARFIQFALKFTF